MKKLIIVSLNLLFILLSQVHSQATEVKAGVYIISLYDFDYPNNTFSADLWLWFVLDDVNSELSPISTYEVVNSNSAQNMLDFHEVQEKGIWETRKVKGVFYNNWDLSNYPFDKHVLQIIFEEADLEVDEFEYLPDYANSHISESFHISGWKVAGFDITSQPYGYDTHFGDPSYEGKEGSSYSRLTVNIEIERDAFSEFIKLHTVLFIAILISTLSLLISPTSGDYLAGRSGMIVAMIYAIVLNLQFVNQLIYSSGKLTLTDKLHFVTLFFLLGYFIITILSYILQLGKRPEYSRLLDLYAFGISIVLYPAIIFTLIITV